MRETARAHLASRDDTDGTPGSRRGRRPARRRDRADRSALRLLEAAADRRELLRRVHVEQARVPRRRARAARPRRRSRRGSRGRKSRSACRPAARHSSHGGQRVDGVERVQRLDVVLPARHDRVGRRAMRASSKRITSASSPGMSHATTKIHGCRLASMAAWMPASGPQPGRTVGEPSRRRSAAKRSGRFVATITCGNNPWKRRTVRTAIGSPSTAANALSRPPMRDARPPARMTPAVAASRVTMRVPWPAPGRESTVDTAAYQDRHRGPPHGCGRARGARGGG